MFQTNTNQRARYRKRNKAKKNKMQTKQIPCLCLFNGTLELTTRTWQSNPMVQWYPLIVSFVSYRSIHSLNIHRSHCSMKYFIVIIVFYYINRNVLNNYSLQICKVCVKEFENELEICCIQLFFGNIKNILQRSQHCYIA